SSPQSVPLDTLGEQRRLYAIVGFRRLGWTRSFTLSSSPEQVTDRLPKHEAFRSFVRRQLVHRTRFAQAGQVRINLPLRQCFPDQRTGCRGTAVECLGPGRQVGPQPIARLPAPARPLRPVELGPILAESAAGQGGRAGGVLAVTGAGILRQVRVGGEGVGI